MEKVNKIKKCIVCQSDFNRGRHPNKKTCSKECYKKHRFNIDEEKRKQPKTIPIHRIKKCVVCDGEFDYGKHKEKKTCSKECYKIHMDNIKEYRMNRTKEGIFKKYGVYHNSQISGFSSKVKKTKKEKYGDENYNNKEKIKKTNKEKYGVVSVLKLKDFRDKGKKTKKEKYGNENYNNTDKAKKTNKEKYGVDHHFKNKDFLNDYMNVFNEKYGVKTPLLLNKTRENLKKHNLKKYGVEFYFSSEEHLEKQRKIKEDNMKSFLEENNLSFDFSNYKKVREIDDDGILKNIKYTLTCNVCNNSFESALIKNKIFCRNCFPKESASKIQVDIRNILLDVGVEFEEENRNLINPKELDFYIDSHNFAIEVNGNYWHSEFSGEKDKKYHYEKSDLCNKLGIDLFHFYEDEIMFKKEIVRSNILKRLNIFEKNINISECNVKEVSYKDMVSFLEENCLFGYVKTKFNYGLYYNNELVSLITLSRKSKKDNENIICNLIRFCDKKNYKIDGSLKVLLDYFFEKNKSVIGIEHSIDIRTFGFNYKKTEFYKYGFYFDSFKSSKCYFLDESYIDRYSSLEVNKKTLLENGDINDDKISFIDLAKKNGYDIIWDCGSIKMKFLK